jgi:hypothetical protein
MMLLGTFASIGLNTLACHVERVSRSPESSEGEAKGKHLNEEEILHFVQNDRVGGCLGMAFRMTR